MNSETKDTAPESRETNNAARDDLPERSAAAIINSVVDLVRQNAGIEIAIRRERLAGRERNHSMFVVTLPPEATPEQRMEADYWLNEITPLFRYAEEASRTDHRQL